MQKEDRQVGGKEKRKREEKRRGEEGSREEKEEIDAPHKSLLVLFVMGPTDFPRYLLKNCLL